jgi:hypothetical protein
LRLFRFISGAQRKLATYILTCEVLFRAGNSSGKTFCGAALAVAMLRGLKSLAGVQLPDLPTPCVGWCVVQTYKGQVDGAQAAILHWIGEWPHKAVYGISEARGWIDTLWIATAKCTHGMDEKCKTCSKLVFHCAESTSNVGGRVHFVWADEPPKKELWDECRQRSTAKNVLVRYITATPKEKVWWAWMPADFHDCEDKPLNGFVEIRSSMYDNKALSPEVLKQKLQAAEKDLRSRAVIFGDYVDLKGESPFPPDRLELWLKRCRPPRIEEMVISAERRTADGDVLVPVRCKVEIFADYDEQETYVGILDPATFLRLDPISGLVATDWTREGSSSRGVPDPCGLHLYARRRPKLVVRFVGYCGAHGLGSLGGILARLYGKALLDTDLTGGHGDPTVRALTSAGYYRLNRYDASVTNPGGGDNSLGFKMNAGNRAEMVAAIQQALLDDALICESAEAIKSLMEVTYVMTPSGRERPEASYGAKDEDMICMGRFLQLHTTTPLPRAIAVTPEQKLSRLLGGRVLRGPEPGRRTLLWSPAKR